MHLMNRARKAPGTRASSSVRRSLWRTLALAVMVAATSVTIPARPAASQPVEAMIAAPPTGAGSTQPSDLRDVNAWVTWKNARQIVSLPLEARIFYRRGLMAQQSGLQQEALSDLRGAAELDPAFLEPHLTLAGWAFPADPAQMLTHFGAVVERVRDDFNLQFSLAANTLILGLEALFAGLLLAALLIVFHHRNELAHPLHEELARLISGRTARLWVPVLLVLPFLAGAGLTLPVLGLLAFLWSHLKLRERMLTVALALTSVFAPIATGTLTRFTHALDTQHGPYHELPVVEHEPWSRTRQDALVADADRDPRDGFAQFALAWYARRGGDLETAEKAYRAVLEAWPADPSALTNMGNVAAMRGQTDDAMRHYHAAVDQDPLLAAPHFNASQLHLRRFEYADANRELRTASALDFDLVKQYQSQAGSGGMLALVDVWPAPARFWSKFRATPAPGRALPLPLALRGRLESGGLLFSFAALFALGLGGWLGHWQASRLPLRICSNCSVVVCRRCAKRRRENALCSACDAIASSAETPEFSRVLMLQYRGRRRDRARLLRTALAALVPGYGLLAHQRVIGPTCMLALTWLLGRLLLGGSAPFSLGPRLTLPGSELPASVLVALIVLVYAWSLLAYFVVVSTDRRREQQLESAGHGRITQSTQRQSNLAA